MAELISVIIPAYNAEKYIERCIRSIQNQTYQNVEIIVVNDGSVDGTETAARRCCVQDARIQVISQENKGVSAARNRGMEEAKGEYLAFVDADDTLPAEALEVLMKKLLEERADIVSGTIRVIHRSGMETEETAAEEIWTGTTALEKSLEDHIHTYSVCGKLFRKEFVKNISFAEGRKVHEDSFFLFECFRHEPRMACFDRCVYLCHISENSASRTNFSEKYFDILYFAECKYKVIQNEYPQYEQLAKNMMIKANMALLKILCKENGKRYRQEERTCIRWIQQNQQYFLPSARIDKSWFFVIKYHLYPVGKLCCRWKHRIEIMKSRHENFID